MKLVSLYENEKCYLDTLFYYVVQWSKNDIIAACDTNVLLLQGITSSPFTWGYMRIHVHKGCRWIALKKSLVLYFSESCLYPKHKNYSSALIFAIFATWSS